MRRSLTSFFVPLLLVTAGYLGCGGDKDSGGGTCPGGAYSCGQVCDGANPPAECEQACGSSAPCPSGFYCGGDGTCTSDCTSTGDAHCPNGLCTADGHCEEPPDAGGTGGGSGGTGGGGGNVCARESVTATAVTPNVVFLIDRSGSMEAELDLTDGIQCPCEDQADTRPHNCYDNACDQNQELSRWDSLRSVLVGDGGADTGLIGALQSQVNFGIAMYTATGSQDCPDMDYAATSGGNLSLGLNNYAAIESVYNTASPGTWTPTGDAMNALVSELDDTGVLADPDPTIIILATDGEPGRCSNLSQGDIGSTGARNASVSAVEAAYDAGVRTFVLAVADDSQLAQSHIDELANAGLGRARDASPAAESWRITSVSDLETALESIVQGQISCTVNLEGEVTDLAVGCETGEVFLVGPGNTRTPVDCDPVDGWTLVDANTMELHGAACDTLQKTPGMTLDASFPCGVVIVIPL